MSDEGELHGISYVRKGYSSIMIPSELCNGDISNVIWFPEKQIIDVYNIVQRTPLRNVGARVMDFGTVIHDYSAGVGVNGQMGLETNLRAIQLRASSLRGLEEVAERFDLPFVYSLVRVLEEPALARSV